MKTWTSTLILSESEEAFEANLAQLRENAQKTGVDELTVYMNEQIAQKKALYE